MIFLLKSHVAQHYRQTQSGQLSFIHDYWDGRRKQESQPKPGQLEMLQHMIKVYGPTIIRGYNRETPVRFKPVNGKSFRTGKIIDIGTDHYTVQGKRDSSGKVETHAVPKTSVVSLPEWEGLKNKVSVDKTAFSNQRAETGMKRIGISESEILKHPKIKATTVGSTYKLARSNGLDTAMSKDGDIIQVQDPDYQDMLVEYIMGATHALRRETANASDSDVVEFKDYLAGKADSSRIALKMASEGKAAAIKFLNKRKEEKDSLVDTTSLDDPEGRGTGEMSRMFSTEAEQEGHVEGPLHVGLDRVLSNLPEVHAEIIRRKFGIGEHETQSNEDIAEELNNRGLKYQDKYKWDRNYVGQAFQEALLKLRDVAGVAELKDYLKSVRERLTLLKSEQKTIIPLCLIKSYSSDLMEAHPGGRWITVKQGPLEGRHLYILPHGDGGARVVAGGGPHMKGRVLGGASSTKNEDKAKEPHEMTKEEFRDFVRKQGEERKYGGAASLDDYSPDGTKNYPFPFEIRTGNGNYSWRISDHKMRGRSMAFSRMAYLNGPAGFNEKISVGNSEFSKKHTNQILRLVRKHQIQQALSDGKHVPEHVLNDYPDLAAKHKPADEPVTIQKKEEQKGYKIPPRTPEGTIMPRVLREEAREHKSAEEFIEAQKGKYMEKLKEMSPGQPDSWYRHQADNQPSFTTRRQELVDLFDEANKGEVSKGTVHLTIQGLKGLEKKEVSADIHGHLAVHKTHEGEGYQITHTPTGLHIKDSIPTKESATELAHKLNNAGVDWNFSDPDSTTSEMYGKVKDVLREHEESQKAAEKQPEPGKIEKIAVQDGYLKLSASQHNSLMAVRHEINNGNPGRRIPIKDDDGYITGWTAEASTYPDYFQGKGYTRSDALTAIDKALNGKKLTKKQQVLVEDLNHSYRQKYASLIAKERATKEATAFQLKQGDTLKRGGVKYVVKKVDHSGFFPEATLQNGAVLKIEGEETIGYDRGTLKTKDGVVKKALPGVYLLRKARA